VNCARVEAHHAQAGHRTHAQFPGAALERAGRELLVLLVSGAHAAGVLVHIARGAGGEESPFIACSWPGICVNRGETMNLN